MAFLSVIKNIFVFDIYNTNKSFVAAVLHSEQQEFVSRHMSSTSIIPNKNVGGIKQVSLSLGQAQMTEY